jgi:hypothetical protein
MYEISSSHDGEYGDDCPLGCCTMISKKLTDISEVLTGSIINHTDDGDRQGWHKLRTV